jgi:hypothetical protein
MNNDVYRIERATNRGTYVEWWPIREWSAPYSDVLQYLADTERKYPDDRFRVVLAV